MICFPGLSSNYSDTGGNWQKHKIITDPALQEWPPEVDPDGHRFMV